MDIKNIIIIQPHTSSFKTDGQYPGIAQTFYPSSDLCRTSGIINPIETMSAPKMQQERTLTVAEPLLVFSTSQDWKKMPGKVAIKVII